jgi:hypothetical protein
MSVRSLVRALALLVALICVACGGATGQRSAVHARLLDSVSPIDDFLLGGAGEVGLQQATETATHDCMKKKGWDYITASTVPQSDAQEPRAPQALLAWRRKYGYGLLNIPPSSGGARKTVDGQEQYVAALSPTARAKYVADLGGTRDIPGGESISTGCRGQAEVSAHKSFPAFNEAIGAELQRDSDAMQVNPQYQAATRAWSSCMAKSGFAYQDLLDGRRAVTARLDDPPSEALDAFERKVGGTDAECLLQTVWPVQARLERAIVQGIVDKYPTAMTCRAACK